MSQGEPPAADRPATPPPSMSPDDALPPVEPPGVGFLIKLFVVPGIIVVVVVTVVLAFNFLARSSGDPQTYLKALEQGAPNSWQCAHDLAILLGQDERLRGNAEFAKRLSDLVVARVKSGPPRGKKKEERLNEAGLRAYLCIALGHFAVPSALPGLVAAATHDRGPEEFAVRAATVLPLATLATNAREIGKPLEDPRVMKLLLEASRYDGSCSYTDEDDEGNPRSKNERRRLVRQVAATALGMVGGPKAISRLETLLGGFDTPNVKFNAAAALARHGNTKCLEMLAEMIDPDSQYGLDEEKDDGARTRKRWAIRSSGLIAAEQLAQANAKADLQSLVDPINKLIAHPQSNAKIKGKAREVLNILVTR